MQRLVKNVVKVAYKVNDESKEKLIAAKTASEAIAAVIEEVGAVPEDISTENLGAKIAIVPDEEFYKIATYKDIKID